MITLITFIAVLSLLVFVHELGHFAAAKFFKVRVDKFAIGFPPKIYSFKRGETEYALNIVPLGGYVSIKGETGEFKDEEDSFSHKPIWQRCIILAAGVVMNFLTAIVLITIGFLVGLPMPIDDNIALSKSATVANESIQIIQILDNSPASKAELGMGDIIQKVNGQSFREITNLQAFLNQFPDDKLEFEIKRGDEIFIKEIGTQKLKETDKHGIGVALVKSANVSYPLHVAFFEATKRTGLITGEIVKSFGKLIAKIFTKEEVGFSVSGPIGIAVITGEVSRLGLVYLLQFTALLSINLAIINLMPFPALDGARILFSCIEGFRGRAFDQRLENIVHTLGFSLLMLLMIFVTYKDIARYGGKILSSITSIFS